MHEYLKFFGTNNQQETVRFLIYERGLLFLQIGGLNIMFDLSFIGIL